MSPANQDSYDAAAETFGSRIRAKFTESGGCWLWHGSPDAKGYGRFEAAHGEGRFNLLAHRLVYTLLRGRVDPLLDIDHLCRNRRCVNPAHLEPVPHAVNVLRGDAPTAINARRTECPKGHQFDALNTRWRRDGTRICKRCRQDRQNRYRRRLGRAWLATRAARA